MSALDRGEDRNERSSNERSEHIGYRRRVSEGDEGQEGARRRR